MFGLFTMYALMSGIKLDFASSLFLYKNHLNDPGILRKHMYTNPASFMVFWL